MTQRRHPDAVATRAAAIAAAVVVALAASGPAGAASGEVALTLSRAPDGSETLSLTLDELAAMPQVTVVTANEFVDGEVAFRGPLVREVIDQLALRQVDALTFTAANDYYVEIPMRDLATYDVILAMEADGRPLSRRDRGPLWVISPMSDHAELRQSIYTSRLIWQVIRIEAP